MIKANRLIPHVFSRPASTSKANLAWWPAWCLRVSDTWWLRHLVGKYAAVSGPFCLVVGQWLLDDSESKVDPTSLVVFRMAIAAVLVHTGFVSVTNAKSDADRIGVLTANAMDDSIQATGQAIRDWLSDIQSSLPDKSYRVTLLLPIELGEGNWVLKPFYRDSKHTITESSSLPTICSDDASRCQGVAGRAWIDGRRYIEAATVISPQDDFEGYCNQMQVDSAFASSCHRKSTYYLGASVNHGKDTLGIVTVDSTSYSNLIGTRVHPNDLSGRKHKMAVSDVDKRSNELEHLVYALMRAGGIQP